MCQYIDISMHVLVLHLSLSISLTITKVSMLNREIFPPSSENRKENTDTHEVSVIFRCIELELCEVHHVANDG
jgi:hypothetical protein